MTKRERLLQVAKSSGNWPSALDGPDPPEDLEELLDVYWELRIAGGLTHQELLAYSSLTGCVFSLSDVDDLHLIDGIVRRAIDAIDRRPENASRQSHAGPRTQNSGRR